MEKQQNGSDRFWASIVGKWWDVLIIFREYPVAPYMIPFAGSLGIGIFFFIQGWIYFAIPFFVVCFFALVVGLTMQAIADYYIYTENNAGNKIQSDPSSSLSQEKGAPRGTSLPIDRNRGTQEISAERGRQDGNS